MSDQEEQTGEVDEAEEVFDGVFPSSDESSEVVHPREKPLHFPATIEEGSRGTPELRGTRYGHCGQDRRIASRHGLVGRDYARDNGYDSAHFQ